VRSVEFAEFLAKPRKKAIFLFFQVLWRVAKKTIINSFCVYVAIAMTESAGQERAVKDPGLHGKLYSRSFFASVATEID